LHENNSNDEGYRKFLARAFDPLKEKISNNAIGLDFGCGPGPTISKMGEELNIRIENYDLYYFNRPELLNRKYDFVIMTEVIEHIADAASLLQQLDSLLKPNAILAIMTKRVIDQQRFGNWHYKNDLTHIRFYSIKTFEWLAKKLNWRLEIIEKDVVFLYKN
ncbi:MAG: class I SAM-dependent methyltransferase, partial [Gammaproteobacteria bacterium]|nr:class I SAM-dependent methyltransferase [Gammaproteobacteria bacterium]